MRVEPVEIYSDKSNAAILRHPGRRFPGVLIQGDTLWTLCYEADIACENIPPGYRDIFNNIRNSLWGLLIHYKTVLTEHDIPLPFTEIPPITGPLIDRSRLLLSIQRGLLGVIPPHLRGVTFGSQGEQIRLRFIFDGIISEENDENMRVVASEVISDFKNPLTIAEELIRADFPERLNKFALEGWAYIRKEPEPPDAQT